MMFKNLFKTKTKTVKSEKSFQSKPTEITFGEIVDKINSNDYQINQLPNYQSNPNAQKIRIEDVQSKIDKAPINELINYMKSSNEIERTLAAQAFSVYESPNLLNCIEMMLADKSENLRISCMEALANISSPETLLLFELGLKDESPLVRLKAVMGVADLASLYNLKSAITVLNSALQDTSTDVREFAIDELGLIGNQSSVKSLLKAMENANDIEKDLISESLSMLLSRMN